MFGTVGMIGSTKEVKEIMMELQMFIPPLVGSVIGYTTNWLAIKMLFKPHRAYHIGRVKVPFTPGVIPREKDRIAKSLGEAVGTNLLTEDVILKELTNGKVIQSLKEYVMTSILQDEFTVQQVLDELQISERFIMDAIRVTLGKEIQSLLVEGDTLIPMIRELFCQSLPADKPIAGIFGDEGIGQFEKLLSSHKVGIANGLCILLAEEETAEQIKKAISNILTEKMGGLAAMFVQPESLYAMIQDSVRTSLEVEENQDKMVAFIVKGAKPVFEMTQPIFSGPTSTISCRQVLPLKSMARL